jgi:hypothetical protein
MADYTQLHHDIMVSLQWNPFSDYMQTPTGELSGEGFPKFTFQYTQSAQSIR